MGVDPHKELYDGDRPVPITDHGHPIERLFRSGSETSQTEADASLTAMDELRTEGAYWLARARSETTLRQMIQVLKALASQT